MPLIGSFFFWHQLKFEKTNDEIVPGKPTKIEIQAIHERCISPLLLKN